MLLLESGLTRGLIMEQFKKIIPILVIIAIYGGITTIYCIDNDIPIRSALDITVPLLIGFFLLYLVKSNWKDFMNK